MGDDDDDDDDDVLAKLDYLIQECDDGASESAQQGVQNFGSDVGGSSWRNIIMQAARSANTGALLHNISATQRDV